MMRKFIFSFIIVLSFFFTIPVFAEDENRLLFTLEENEDGEERIVYDAKLFNKDYFMKHTDMAPGRVYKDNIVIENGTEDTYSIFLKMVPRDEDDELIKDITIKVYCRDKLTYTGSASGGEVNEEFDDAVFICAIEAGKEADVRFESILNKKNTTIDSDLSYTESIFYAQYGDYTPIEIVENVEVNPETNRDKYMIPIKIVGLIGMVIMIVIILFQNNREKEEKLNK